MKTSTKYDIELPDIEEALERATDSLESPSQFGLCGCQHLRQILPTDIALDFVRTPQGTLILKDPVQALHLGSQLGPGWLKEVKSAAATFLYGSEQERAVAARSTGLAETWNTLLLDHSTSERRRLNGDGRHQGEDPPKTTSAPAALDDIGTSGNDEFIRKCYEEEDTILNIRKALFTRKANATKRQKNLVSTWREEVASPTRTLSADEMSLYEQEAKLSSNRMTQWVHTVRFSRILYWRQRKRRHGHTSTKACFGRTPPRDVDVRCMECNLKGGSCEGLLMHCLDCSYIGCAPCSLDDNTYEHMLYHALESNHNLAITNEAIPKVYCFACSDVVSHQIFDRAVSSVDVAETLPWLKVPEATFQRTFDAFNFLRIGDDDIFWNGLKAVYAQNTPRHRLNAINLIHRRHTIVQGLSSSTSFDDDAKAVMIALKSLDKEHRCRIRKPVGFYNLGNTCYQSTVLQCLVHCPPLQDFFLRETRHHCSACRIRQRMLGVASGHVVAQGPCLACEFDRLLVAYLEHSTGISLSDAVLGRSETFSPTLSSTSNASCEPGHALALSDLLAATWRTPELMHLAGYAQHDSHEAFHAIVDVLGKNTFQFDRWMGLVNEHCADEKCDPSNRPIGICSTLFEGTLRSVLVCQKCGSKRIQKESFTSISLPLSNEFEQLAARRQSLDQSHSSPNDIELSLRRCLDHFTAPETLSDIVDCPVCKAKTPTTKQHVISRLPKVLCFHFKRFDALANKKIENFVSFPPSVNMGGYIPHWKEVSIADQPAGNAAPAHTSADMQYQLFGTVNHVGSLSSGHYTANVKVDDAWYHCNDAYVWHAGEGTGETAVLASNAYLLFYVRQ